MTKCLNCENTLVGRSDKKFCDTYCRNSYNNKIRSGEEAAIIDVNKILRKNRSILKKYCPHGSAKVRMSILKNEGFSFNHFTGRYITKGDQSEYLFCYDWGYRCIEQKANHYVLIILKQDYMSDQLNP